ncbi:TauD/TfdA family dioxygenase [Kitasatospora sp. NPDC051853]|uniref:TauD/TfdA family dioxygenase n=1 Tax=Kitasatospora sp. NPDC051853 TaxID=3364058 RepID=UPI003795B84A
MREFSGLAGELLSEPVDAEGRSTAELIAAAHERLKRNHIVLVGNFPVDSDRFVGFLGGFGPLMNGYAAHSDAHDDLHPQLNQVRYRRRQEGVKHSVHYVDGPLSPHSARAWADPRPSYFTMLMVDPGWQDLPDGQRGESVVMSWRHLFRALAERDGEVFEEHFARLTSTPVTFHANNVKEPVSSLPLLYPLADAEDRYDVGVRMKQDMREKVLELKDEIEDFDDYQRSLHYLLDACAEEGLQACFPMRAGDVLLMDNDRYGHGRRSTVGERTVDGEAALNGRELWSTTLA